MTKAIKDHKGLCWKCLQTKENVKIIEIPELGYGSGFDGFSTEIHLCEKCYNESNPKIWELNILHPDDEFGGEYEYEEEIFNYFQSLSIEGKQFVYNEFDKGWDARPMPPQDWIDYEEKTLSHERCKELGLYSHQEIDAYRERFPICEHPVNKLYEDGSCGCWCPFGAHGRKDQTIDSNISDACYMCEHFKERTSPRKEILSKEWEEYKLYVKYNANKKNLEEKFGE